MKMNFGNWIVVAFILFAVFIGTLVTVCVREDVELVSRDYYQQELLYQDQIQRLNNTADLKERPELKIVNQRLRVTYNRWGDIDNGELKLFCPSNPNMDRNFPLVQSGDPVQYFGVENLQKGMYRAKFTWEMNGKEFYIEEVVHI